LGCDMVDIDSMVPLEQARREMGAKVVLAGNLDPVKTLRNGSPAGITAALGECHRQAGPRYIVAAGCEVPRDTSEANVRAMTAYARSHGA
jgi:uroporphyrinogen-III decarboxylase